MNKLSCARCDRELAPGDERHVPTFIAGTTAFAFAFFHGGMWAKETLDKPFCARCARVVAGSPSWPAPRSSPRRPLD